MGDRYPIATDYPLFSVFLRNLKAEAEIIKNPLIKWVFLFADGTNTKAARLVAEQTLMINHSTKRRTKMSTVSTIGSKSKSAKSDVASTEDIQAEIANIRGNIASLGKTVAAYGKSKAGVVQSKASEKSADLVQASEQAISELQQQLETISSQVEKRVRAKPLQSLAIAAGIGFVISLLARR